MPKPDRRAPLVARLALPGVLGAGALTALPGAAGAAPDPEIEIHLITIGPGEHVLTAGGHSALMVAELRGGAPDPARTRVYNFGDADFDDPALPLRFLRGDAEFRLAIAGTLQEVVDDYGIRQARDVWRQRLNLTAAQAARVAERLAADAHPERRAYRYHHHGATCTTKIRDLLDEVTEGALTRALAGEPATPGSAREVQRVLFRKHHLAAIGGDLVFGRLHDHPVDKYWALVDPPRMSEHLQEVEVAAPGGGGLVPLAEPPVALIRYVGPQVTEMPSIVTPLVAALAMLLLGLGGRRAIRGLPARTSGAGLVLVLYPAISGLLGALLAAICLLSGVPELRENENVLLFPATDLLLVAIGLRWLRRPLRPGELRALGAYAYARLGLLALVVLLHLGGALYQRPRIFVALSLLFSALLVALVRRARATTSPLEGAGIARRVRAR